MRRKSNGWVSRRKDPKSKNWFIGYFVEEIKGGRKVRRKVREAVGPKKSVAMATLAQRIRDMDDGKWQHPAKPLTFEDLLELVKADWRNNGRKASLTTPSGKDQSHIKHLRAAFGCADVAGITKARELPWAQGSCA